jgi:hypothetical protein
MAWRQGDEYHQQQKRRDCEIDEQTLALSWGFLSLETCPNADRCQREFENDGDPKSVDWARHIQEFRVFFFAERSLTCRVDRVVSSLSFAERTF